MRHTVREAGAVVLVEEQDLVYRGFGDSATPRLGDAATRPGARSRAHGDLAREATWTRTIQPNEALLFRYSALTFNTHRIHYDRQYAKSEGYPGLVVHGPLIATLLLGLIETNMPDATVERFEFKAKRPAFDGTRLMICGAPSDRQIGLWSVDGDGDVGVEANAWIH